MTNSNNNQKIQHANPARVPAKCEISTSKKVELPLSFASFVRPDWRNAEADAAANASMEQFHAENPNED